MTGITSNLKYYFMLTVLTLLAFLIIPQTQEANNNKDNNTLQETDQAKREAIKMSIITDPRHPDWCNNRVNKEEYSKKGIKEFPYSNYLKDYSKEALEKIFPVPDQWKEWYELDKIGKLPKYIKISDRNCWYIMHDLSTNTDCLRNRNMDNMLKIIGYKNSIQNAQRKSLNSLYNEIEKEGGIFPWYWKNQNVYNPIFFPIYVKTIEEWDKKDKMNVGLVDIAFNCISYSIIDLYKHPLFFAKELTVAKTKYTPIFWDIYKNADKITIITEDQRKIKKSCLGILYLLGEDLDNLLKQNENLSDDNHPGLPFCSKIELWDIVNGKVIEIIDPKLKSAKFKRLNSKNKSSWRNAILYFYDIDELNEHLDSAIEYCRKYFSRDGFYILKLLTPFKDNPDVHNLAEHYYKNIDKFTTDVDRSIAAEFIKKEFILSGEKNEK